MECSFSNCSWKGATTPWLLYWMLCLPVHRRWPTELYDLPGTTFHTFSYWIHKSITIVVQPASSISESPNTESLKPCQQHRQHNNNQIQLHLQISYFTLYMLLGRTQPACIRSFTKDNPRTDLQILTYNSAAISDIKTYPDHNNKRASIDLVYPQSNHMKIIIPSLEIPFHHSSSST